MLRRLKALATVALLIAAGGGPITLGPRQARAGAEAVAETQRSAYAADYAAGIANLDALLRRNPDDTEALFGKGALQLFSAFATFQRSLQRHTGTVAGGRAIGFLGVLGNLGPLAAASTLPGNPDAIPMTYDILRQVLATFVTDLSAAETTLAAVAERPVKLPLVPAKIVVDIDGDGKFAPHERVFSMLFPVHTLRLGLPPDPAATQVEVAFDTADANWLRGYANAFLASANLLLAVDFESAYDATAHVAFGDTATEFGRVLADQVRRGRASDVINAEIKVLDGKISELREKARQQRPAREKTTAISEALRALAITPENAEQRNRLQAELAELDGPRRDTHRRIAELDDQRATLAAERDGPPDAWLFDLVALVHNLSWTVIEPARLEATRIHLLRVMEQNQTAWRLLRAETDDDREWLAGPQENTSGVVVGEPDLNKVIDDWLITNTAAAEVLRGERLLPHPRFKQGINVKKLFQSARHVDAVMLITGHAAIAFLEDGPLADPRTWHILASPLHPGLGAHSFWPASIGTSGRTYRN